MKNLFRFLAILGVFLPSLALGQNQGDLTPLGSGGTKIMCNVNESAANTAAAGTLNFPSCTRKGALLTGLDWNYQASTNKGLLKLEDDAHASGDAGVMSLGVVNVGQTVLAANGDYAPIAVNTLGAIRADINFSDQSSGGGANALLKLEDSAAGSTDAGVMSLAVREDTLTQSTNASGDYTPLKTDSLGRLITTPLPYASRTIGCNSAITTATSGCMIAADASNRIVIGTISCTNTGGTASRVNIIDTDASIYATTFLPATSGTAQLTFPIPLVTSVNKCVGIDVITSGTSTICCAYGFKSVN